MFLFQHLFLHNFFSPIFLSYNFSYIFLSIFCYLLLIFFHCWRTSSYFTKSCWHLNFKLCHSLLVVGRTNIANYLKKKILFSFSESSISSQTSVESFFLEEFTLSILELQPTVWWEKIPCQLPGYYLLMQSDLTDQTVLTGLISVS